MNPQKKISALPIAASIDATASYFPINNTAVTERINRNVFLGVTGQPADISSSQNITNKTLNNTNIVTLRDDRFTLQDNLDTTKQAVFQLSGITTATTRTFTFPNGSTTLVGSDTTQTLTNKTLAAPTITGGSISNTTISVDAISEFTPANGVTIDGLNIKDGKLNTNDSVVTANITDSAVIPAKLFTGTGSSWVWQTWTPTWTNLTIGNAVVIYGYSQIGKTVVARGTVEFGTTTSVSGTPTFTLPVTRRNYATGASPVMIGLATFVDNGTADYPIIVESGSTTAGMLNALLTNGTYLTRTGTTSTVPFTWTTGDKIIFEIFYEAA